MTMPRSAIVATLSSASSATIARSSGKGVRMSKISEVRELAAMIEDEDHDVLDRVECVETRQDAGLTPQLRRQQGAGVGKAQLGVTRPRPGATQPGVVQAAGRAGRHRTPGRRVEDHQRDAQLVAPADPIHVAADLSSAGAHAACARSRPPPGGAIRLHQRRSPRPCAPIPARRPGRARPAGGRTDGFLGGRTVCRGLHARRPQSGASEDEQLLAEDEKFEIAIGAGAAAKDEEVDQQPG